MVKPVFTAVAAVSLDGRIVHPGLLGSDWTSREDKKFLHDFLDQCDAIVIGHTTYQLAQKPLSRRNCIVLTSRVRKTVQKSSLLRFCNPQAIDLQILVKRLGYKKIAVLGGQKVYSYCLKKKILDELFLTTEPVIFGKGLSLFEGPRLLTGKLKLLSLKRLNARGSILARYRLLRITSQ